MTASRLAGLGASRRLACVGLLLVLACGGDELPAPIAALPPGDPGPPTTPVDPPPAGVNARVSDVVYDLDENLVPYATELLVGNGTAAAVVVPRCWTSDADSFLMVAGLDLEQQDAGGAWSRYARLAHRACGTAPARSVGVTIEPGTWVRVSYVVVPIDPGHFRYQLAYFASADQDELALLTTPTFEVRAGK